MKKSSSARITGISRAFVLSVCCSLVGCSNLSIPVKNSPTQVPTVDKSSVNFAPPPIDTESRKHAVFGDWMVLHIFEKWDPDLTRLCQVYEETGLESLRYTNYISPIHDAFDPNRQWRAADDVNDRTNDVPAEGVLLCWEFYGGVGGFLKTSQSLGTGVWPSCTDGDFLYLTGDDKKHEAGTTTTLCTSAYLDIDTLRHFKQEGIIEFRTGLSEGTVSLTGFDAAYDWAVNQGFINP